MRHHIYTHQDQTQFPICILVPQIRAEDIRATYLTPFDINPDEVLVMDLHQTGKKTSAKDIKAYVEDVLVDELIDAGVTHILCADGEYFKILTKQATVEKHLGYVMDCAFGPWKVVYAPNFKQIFYDPDTVRAKIAMGVSALIADRTGAYKAPGADIIKSSAYPMTDDEIEDWLERLLEMDKPLAIDIETFDLKHHKAGLGTMTICWSKHEGIAFPIDYVSVHPDEPFKPDSEGYFGYRVRNQRRRDLVRSFFERLCETAIYHNIAFDVYVLIYELFMKHILDTEGLLEGLEVMLRDWDDTKLVTYLATNSCAGNKLGLKAQAHEFSGNYAVEEIHDIRRIPLPNLLQYNLIDGLSTWYVREKHYPTMIADDQLPIYQGLFKDTTKDIIQMQLTGMPVDMPRVKEVKLILEADEKAAVDRMMSSPIVTRFTQIHRDNLAAKANAKYKKKRVTGADFTDEFNPNSGDQVRIILYEMLGLPIIDLTKNKQAATGAKTLEKLLNHTADPEILDFLGAMKDYASVNKILTGFIPAMENAALGPDGWHYMFGNFNLGGTISGRLSSSDPNLQNLPANSKYAKLIKSCFKAPPGWLFIGLDFASLEDRISALTSKDPEKLKVYTDGYDGHSLRAFTYFRERMPLIRQSEGRKVFVVTQGGETHHLLEGDEVTTPEGAVLKVEELFQLAA